MLYSTSMYKLLYIGYDIAMYACASLTTQKDTKHEQDYMYVVHTVYRKPWQYHYLSCVLGPLRPIPSMHLKLLICT